MEILNSPLILLVAAVIIAAVIFYRKRKGLDRRCGACDQGTLDEVSVKPEKLVDGSSADTSSSAWVLYSVRYKCTHCDNTLVRTENRR